MERKDKLEKIFNYAIGCFGLVGVLVAVIALFVTLRSPSFVIQLIEKVSDLSTSTPIVIEVTRHAPSTEMPTLYPTDTPSPTGTPIPINTAIPTATSTVFVPPADGVLFQDNFDKSMSPDWAVGSGTWLISKGRLTMLPGDPYTTAYSWISLNKPEWKNYILRVNVNDTYTNIGNQFVIVVRDGSAQRIGVVVNSLADTYLALIGDGWSNNSPITDEKFNFPVNTNTNVEIEVQNDNYILRVNGRELQNITLSGFDSGGISIGLNCDSDCPSFDDVKVTYLP